jgi:hypothetical protein
VESAAHGWTSSFRDTISFADTNVYIIEIVPDRDPAFPPDAAYPDKRESILWQAQFQPAPLPPCPPTGYPELDNNPAFRNQLNALYFLSVGLGTEQAAFRQKKAGQPDTLINVTIRSDNCHIFEMDTLKMSLPGYTYGGFVHTHILPEGSDTPPTCGRERGPIPNGPSMHDWPWMVRSPGRDYVIDNDEVHIVDDKIPGETLTIRKPIPWPAQCRVMLPVP